MEVKPLAITRKFFGIEGIGGLEEYEPPILQIFTEQKREVSSSYQGQVPTVDLIQVFKPMIRKECCSIKPDRWTIRQEAKFRPYFYPLTFEISSFSYIIKSRNYRTNDFQKKNFPLVHNVKIQVMLFEFIFALF